MIREISFPIKYCGIFYGILQSILFLEVHKKSKKMHVIKCDGLIWKKPIFYVWNLAFAFIEIFCWISAVQPLLLIDSWPAKIDRWRMLFFWWWCPFRHISQTDPQIHWETSSVEWEHFGCGFEQPSSIGVPLYIICHRLNFLAGLFLRLYIFHG